MFRKLFLVGLVCAFMAPTNVFAEKGKWSFTPYVGANVATSRDMVESSTLSLTAAATTSDFTVSAAFAANVKELSFDDTHNTPLLTGFDVGHFIRDDLEIFGGFQYVTASGNSTKVADVSAAFNFTQNGTTTAIGATDTVNAEFDDYDSWAIKVGATKYFPMASFTPYIGGYGGFKHIDEMKVKLTINTANVSGKIKFYDSTNTGFFGFHTGANKSVMAGNMPINLGIRARLDYTPELNGDDADTGLLTGGAKTNEAGGGVDFGLTAQLSIPF
jgi:hypothetical protein